MESFQAPSITRRAALRMAVALPAIPGLLALPTIQQGALPRPVRARVIRIRLDTRLSPTAYSPLGRTLDGQRPRFNRATGAIGTDNFRVAAFTWNGAPSRSALLIRTRDKQHGDWSEWYELHDDQHGPDMERSEARGIRRGTDIAIVGESDAVDVRLESVDDELPTDLYLELIDPGESPADGTIDTFLPGSAAASTPDFTIRTRAQWGADESIRDQSEPDYGSVRGAFVHHTAGSNTYAAADVPGIIRAIYTYHVTGRGWRDIGYNFLVDRFGLVWEGRYGGVSAAVVGAHVAGYNSYSTGASVLGTYTSKAPEPAVLTALQQLIAWKFDRHGVSMSGTVAYPGLATLPTISGHRDGGSTECPGTQLYVRLGALSTRIDAALWRTSVGKVYLFSGNSYVRVSRIGSGADAFYPKAIAGNWPGLPSTFQQGIDAAFVRESNGKIYFFKGSQYIRYSSVARGIDAGYPRPITGNWPGLPDSFNQGIDAALTRRDTGQIYFFKGSQYIRYSSVARGIDPTYPRWIDPNWTQFPFQ